MNLNDANCGEPMIIPRVFQAAIIVYAAAFGSSALAQSVTYDFTGLITSESGYAVIDGTVVTGTYTFDYGVNNYQDGTPGSPNAWDVETRGDTVVHEPPATAEVFSSFMSFAGYSYQGSVNPYYTLADVHGQNTGAASSFSYFEGSELTMSPTGLFMSSSVSLQNLPGTETYTSTGLPVFMTSDVYAQGSLSSQFFNAAGAIATDRISYDITSFTPAVSAVPEPSTHAIFLAGLAILGLVIARLKRTEGLDSRHSFAQAH